MAADGQLLAIQPAGVVLTIPDRRWVVAPIAFIFNGMIGGPCNGRQTFLSGRCSSSCISSPIRCLGLVRPLPIREEGNS